MIAKYLQLWITLICIISPILSYGPWHKSNKFNGPARRIPFLKTTRPAPPNNNQYHQKFRPSSTSTRHGKSAFSTSSSRNSRSSAVYSSLVPSRSSKSFFTDNRHSTRHNKLNRHQKSFRMPETKLAKSRFMETRPHPIRQRQKPRFRDGTSRWSPFANAGNGRFGRRQSHSRSALRTVKPHKRQPNVAQPCTPSSQCHCCRWTTSYKETNQKCSEEVTVCVRMEKGMCLETSKEKRPESKDSKCSSMESTLSCSSCCPNHQSDVKCQLTNDKSMERQPPAFPRKKQHKPGKLRTDKKKQKMLKHKKSHTHGLKKDKKKHEIKKEQTTNSSINDQVTITPKLANADKAKLKRNPFDIEQNDDFNVRGDLLAPPFDEVVTKEKKKPQKGDAGSMLPSERCCQFSEGPAKKSCCMNKPPGMYQRCCPDENEPAPILSRASRQNERTPTFIRAPRRQNGEKGEPLCCSQDRQERYQCCLRLPENVPRHCCAHMEELARTQPRGELQEFRATETRVVYPPQVRHTEKGEPLCCSQDRVERYQCCLILPASAPRHCCAPDHMKELARTQPEQPRRRAELQEFRATETRIAYPPVRHTEKGEPLCCSQDRNERYQCCLTLPANVPRHCCANMEELVPTQPRRRAELQEFRATETRIAIPPRSTEKGDPVCCSQNRQERYECCLVLPPNVPVSCCSAQVMSELERTQHLFRQEGRSARSDGSQCCSSSPLEQYECCLKLPVGNQPTCCSAQGTANLFQPPPVYIPNQELRDAPYVPGVVKIPGSQLCCSPFEEEIQKCCNELPITTKMEGCCKLVKRTPKKPKKKSGLKSKSKEFQNDGNFKPKGDTSWKQDSNAQGSGFSEVDEHPKPNTATVPLSANLGSGPNPKIQSEAVKTLVANSHSNCCASTNRVRTNCCSSTKLMGLKASCCDSSPSFGQTISRPNCCAYSPTLMASCCSESRWRGLCCSATSSFRGRRIG